MMKKINTLGIAALMTLSASALAHTDLVNSYPEDGAMLMQQPETLELSFSEDVAVSSLKMVGSDGQELALDAAIEMETGPGTDLSIVLPNLVPDTYTVQWVVMSPDGHEVSGEVSFMQH